MQLSFHIIFESELISPDAEQHMKRLLGQDDSVEELNAEAQSNLEVDENVTKFD